MGRLFGEERENRKRLFVKHSGNAILVDVFNIYKVLTGPQHYRWGSDGYPELNVIHLTLIQVLGLSGNWR